ncbi:hypothetical protein MGG_15758 [Pyricularia oryzae 70-15]|uniref:Uncharacterized protein n=3 Tax=Pyricularia oryzae TaxID=318829 RepID=G4MUX1_PYRO7|nr:uncharacterized protein MGG_15758 [Pyricularia oryzae 70-15]EHA54901.1 hypothetical protein MGG_15758 [Pyricularia oryzae 70-15]ELQ40468.1 hypothetical protein OOU_Y34scaffold00433g12 [Pyricularia oryzae Y34]
MRVIKLAQFGSTFSAPKVVQSAIIFSRLVLISWGKRPGIVPRPINLLSALRIAEAPVTAFIHISA